MNLEIYGNKKEGFRGSGESVPDVDQLRPCPFCGSGEIVVGNTHTPHYRAECQKCGAEGPSVNPPKRYATKTPASVRRQHEVAFDQAVDAWNKRELIS